MAAALANPMIRIFQNVIGFTPAERALMLVHAFTDLGDLVTMSESSITKMAEEMAKRTVNEGRVIVGMVRVGRMVGLMHQVQDMVLRCNDPITAEDVTRMSIDEAHNHEKVRKTMRLTADAQAAICNPGKFTDVNKFVEFQEGLITMLSCKIGVDGVPLSYVLREVDNPVDDEHYPTFMQRAVARAALTGPTFMADNQAVYTILQGLINGGPGEQHIRARRNLYDGRGDFKILVAHFAGEGNRAKRLLVADILFKVLHYKSEKAVKFETFLASAQRKMDIYAKEGQPMHNEQKVRWIFGAVVGCHHLDSCVAAQKEKRWDEPTLSYIRVANALHAAVSEMSETSIDRRVSAMKAGPGAGGRSNGGRGPARGGGGGRGDRSGRGGRGHGRGGRGHNHGIGYIPNEKWAKMSPEERKATQSRRAEVAGPGAGDNRTIGEMSAAQEDRIVNRVISAARSCMSVVTEAELDEGTNAGDSFGGRGEATKRRKTS